MSARNPDDIEALYPSQQGSYTMPDQPGVYRMFAEPMRFGEFAEPLGQETKRIGHVVASTGEDGRLYYRMFTGEQWCSDDNITVLRDGDTVNEAKRAPKEADSLVISYPALFVILPDSPWIGLITEATAAEVIATFHQRRSEEEARILRMVAEDGYRIDDVETKCYNEGGLLLVMLTVRLNPPPRQ